MDSVSPQDHLCYVRCAHCNTVLAVGVPCKRMVDAVTVKCGHCNSLSYLNPRPSVQPPSLCSNLQMGSQRPCNECSKGKQWMPSSSLASAEETAPNGALYVVKPPEKKHRLPSAYNRFMRQARHGMNKMSKSIGEGLVYRLTFWNKERKRERWWQSKVEISKCQGARACRPRCALGYY